jgi:hypothetical protein
VSDIFREVDEEVRKDKFQALWKQYGVYVYIVVGALVLGTAFNVWWGDYQESRRLDDSARYQAAVALLDKQQSTEAINGLAALAEDAGTGYAVIARLREAAARVREGDLGGAVRAYDTLIQDNGVAQIYRDLARLLSAMHLADGAAAEAVRERLAPLLQDASPWRFSAREIDAMLALRDGQRGRAREILQALVDDAETPAGVRQRAAELLAALASEG